MIFMNYIYEYEMLYMHSLCGGEISVHISVHTRVGVSSRVHACA